MQEGLRDIVNWGRNVINQSDRDAPIVMMTNPRNQGAVTNTGRGMRIQDFPLRMVPVEQLRPWEPMTKMQDLPSQRTVASLRQALQQGDKIPPLLVTPVRGGYRIIDGHHRYAALLQTGVEQAPVRVVDPRLIRYSDEVMEALRTTLRRYGDLGAPAVAEGSYTTEKQILTRIRQIMYDRKLSGTESNASELLRLKQQLKDLRSQQGVAEDADRIDKKLVDYLGLKISLKPSNHTVAVYAFDATGGKQVGQVVFNIEDNGQLEAADLEVAEKYRGQGVARAMYDFVKAQGYTINRSWSQTAAGADFWDKYRGQERVWEQGVAEGIDPNTFEELDARIIAQAAKQIVPTARARRTPEGYVHVTTEDGLDLYIGASVADGVISVNIGSGGGVTTSGAHKGAVTEIIRSVYDAAVRKYGEPDTPGELTIDHDAGHGVWQHIADKLGLRYAAVEVKESGMAEGRISDLDIDLQDQQWDAVVGRVQHGVRRGEDPDRMSLALYQWATGEMFDVDEELERRGFRSVADLADHIRDHGGRYVPPRFDLSAGSLKDIQRRPRQRPDDVSENSASKTKNLYHATYRPVLANIRRQGLGGSAAQAKWEDSEPGVTYLALDPDVARSYAETSDVVPDEWLDQIVVLAIDATQLDPRLLRRDRNVLDDDSTLEYHGVIPATAFVLAENFADGRKPGRLVNDAWARKIK